MPRTFLTIKLNSWIRSLVQGTVFAVCAQATLFAQTALPIQSPARPLGLDITSPAYQAGSDARAASFQTNYLPALNAAAQKRASTSAFQNRIASAGGIEIDPSQITLATDYAVRAYFVSERTGYRNSLGLNTEAFGTAGGDPALLFPNTSTSKRTYLKGDQTTSKRSVNAPLLPGDFADAGTFNAGTQLDFFLLQNGARKNNPLTLSSNPAANAGNAEASIAYAIQGSPYLYLAFNDFSNKKNGALDMNDLVVAIDVGHATVQNVTAPEPQTWAILSLLTGLILILRRKIEKRPSTI